MFLTDFDISFVKSLNAEPMVLSNKFEGAKNAKTAVEQEKPLKEGEWNLKKGRFLMKAVSIVKLQDAKAMDGNPKKFYFSKTSPSVEAINRGIDVSVAKIKEKPLKEGEWNLKKGRFLMKAVSIVKLQDAKAMDGNPKKFYFSKTSPSVEAINRGIDVSVAKIKLMDTKIDSYHKTFHKFS
ncbi:hypothetical protein DAPPUDRAFT_105803 [Daphnia pulex]|uniref:Uncharacterized protein n=1 Tax=Daphnia pulex TaxID=6669 RepID=E9GRU7_DAPPU|nr:hypothetical protein DAPPUDRAFT_105803 [Daphnia pulex]|eukprot:EFX77835.1 hypothetical protein DAPPUDRAFT_105803 [Daphnia pulex]